MYELQVDGMTCGGCANSVKRSIQTIDHNAKVEVDLSGKKVLVDSIASIEVVKKALAEAGFPVVSANPV